MQDYVTPLFNLIKLWLSYAITYPVATVGGHTVYLWEAGLYFLLLNVVIDVIYINNKEQGDKYDE